MEEKLRELLEKIDELVETDFAYDMNTRLISDDATFTQVESQRMAEIIGQVYSWAHRIHCQACGPDTALPRKD